MINLHLFEVNSLNSKTFLSSEMSRASVKSDVNNCQVSIMATFAAHCYLICPNAQCQWQSVCPALPCQLELRSDTGNSSK